MLHFAYLDLLRDVLSILHRLSWLERKANGRSPRFTIQLRTAISLSHRQLPEVSRLEWRSIEPCVKRMLVSLESLCSEKSLDSSDSKISFFRLKHLRQRASALPAKELISIMPLLKLRKENVEKATTVLGECLDVLSSESLDFSEGAQFLSKSIKRRKPPASEFWDLANRLLPVISACQSMACSIHPEFDARLRLLTYLDKKEDEDFFSIEALLSLCSDNREWAEIQVAAQETRTAAAPAVRFDGPRKAAKPGWKMTKPSQIQFICKALGTGDICRTLRHNFVLEDETLWRHNTGDRRNYPLNLKGSVTLRQLLLHGVSHWTAVDKIALSIILGYSLFYFYGGAWLGGKWSRHNILFFTRGGSIPLQPFLRFTNHKNPLDSQVPNEDSPFHRYPSILEFGVTLLEIDLGGSLESLLGCTEEITSIDEQYVRAKDAFSKRKPHIGSKRYRDAIENCLKGDFFEAEEESAERLRLKIYEDIVHPLVEELEDSLQEFICLEMLDKQAPSLNLGPESQVYESQASSSNDSSMLNQRRVTHQQYSFGEEILVRNHQIWNGSQRNRMLSDGSESSADSFRVCSPPRLTASPQPMSRSSSVFRDMNSRPLSRDGFEIAVICALKAEYEALALVFDELWDEEGDSYGKVTGDENTYMTGRVSKHAAVLVLLPGMGKVHAARASTSFRWSYKNIRLALLVGICGGVPKDIERREIILGDIVIGTQVVEYDLVRRYPDGPRRKRDHDDVHGRANEAIRGFVKTLRTKTWSQRLEKRTTDHLAELQRKADGGEYQYPGTSNDKLFRPKYRHKHQDKKVCLTCSRCLQKSDPVCDTVLESSCSALLCSERELVPRERLKRNGLQSPRREQPQAEWSPMIHFGPIASGDSVMRSGEDRDQIARAEGVIAFEMEGSGVWGSLPCIVIKGVCDYADSHKDKVWQKFASATAASAMKAVLERWGRLDRV